MEVKLFSRESGFLVEPLYHISEIVIEKETNESIFEEVFLMLYEYFQDKKDHRTNQDVERVMIKINDLITRKYPDFDFTNEEEKEEQSKGFIEEFTDFLNKNETNINTIFEQEEFSPFLSHWMMNLNRAFRIFEESFELFINKKHKIYRSSRRAIVNTFYRFFELVKATFLVLYRISEQIYMIMNNINYSIEDEIDYLINDIVYLQNIQRHINSSLR